MTCVNCCASHFDHPYNCECETCDLADECKCLECENCSEDCSCAGSA